MQDVICANCNYCRDLDLCRDPLLITNNSDEWPCPQCGSTYDKVSVHLSLLLFHRPRMSVVVSVVGGGVGGVVVCVFVVKYGLLYCEILFLDCCCETIIAVKLSLLSCVRYMETDDYHTGTTSFFSTIERH
jgi:hypothetical protein